MYRYPKNASATIHFILILAPLAQKLTN